MTFYLSDEDVRRLYDSHINAGPLIKPDLLSSAVRSSSWNGLACRHIKHYLIKLRRFCVSLAENQPYQDGNKRIACWRWSFFPEANGYRFRFPTGDAVTLMVVIATKSISLPEIANRLEAHCKRRQHDLNQTFGANEGQGSGSSALLLDQRLHGLPRYCKTLASTLLDLKNDEPATTLSCSVTRFNI